MGNGGGGGVSLLDILLRCCWWLGAGCLLGLGGACVFVWGARGGKEYCGLVKRNHCKSRTGLGPE